jgi:hypothetical protein
MRPASATPSAYGIHPTPVPEPPERQATQKTYKNVRDLVSKLTKEYNRLCGESKLKGKRLSTLQVELDQLRATVCSPAPCWHQSW